jgi:hypothetical protein
MLGPGFEARDQLARIGEVDQCVPARRNRPLVLYTALRAEATASPASPSRLGAFTIISFYRKEASSTKKLLVPEVVST